MDIPPRWTVLVPGEVSPPGRLTLWLEPGPGWGDGRHPTTQLCLQAIAAVAPLHRTWRMLDFGSGSGVLSIAAARLGAEVDAVEIDENAIEHAEQNADRNRVADRIRSVRSLTSAPGPYDLVVANILRPVVSSRAAALAERMARGSALVLSGLVATDVPELTVRFAPLLDGRRPDVHARGDWRALVWRPVRDREL